MRVTVAALIGLACFGCDLPRDPEQTLQRVRGGTIRAGITDNPPWTRLAVEDSPRGLEVGLLEAFAERLEARIQWVRDSEGNLLQALHEGDLDIVLGGLTDSSPWSSEVAFTRPFVDAGDEAHVMAVPLGENRWLLELDKFLQSRSAEIQRQLATEGRR